MFTVQQFPARTLSWWADQRERIDFEPPYQRRGGLWSKRDKAFLIDSILNDYDIPKIYIADFTFGPSPLNPQSKQYAVIDGKQRFEAILDFYDGRLALEPDFSFVEDPSVSLGGLGYRDLKANHASVASKFENFNLTVMSVITDEEGKINELFVRLNRNKTLTGPEIRNAMQGIVPELIRQLATDDFFTTRISFGTQRGQDLDTSAKFLLVEFRGRIVETKRVYLDDFVEEALQEIVEGGSNADAGTEDFERAAERVRENLAKLNQIFLERDPLLATQAPLVPYYWMGRTLPEPVHSSIRPFLVAFETARQSNRQLVKNVETVSQADPELTRYDQLNRSINDAASIEGRTEILLRRFHEFLDTEKVILKPPPAVVADP
jgi:CHASE3 domain sensor protein